MLQKDIKAIVFDFGNVIININPEKTYRFFADLTFKSSEKVKRIFEEMRVFEKFESGFFSENEFYDVVRQGLAYPLNDDEITQAWNALLLDIPAERIEYLERLKLQYPIYLLSNTNTIHIEHCKKYFRSEFGISDFRNFFQKTYFSYEMGLNKPDYKIYQSVLNDLNLLPHQVLFIDDREDNIMAANDMGIKTIKINPPECFTEIFKNIFQNV